MWVTGVQTCALPISDIQSAELAPLVYGVVMIAVILLAPSGVVGILRRFLPTPSGPGRRAAPPDDPGSGSRADTGADTSDTTSVTSTSKGTT